MNRLHAKSRAPEGRVGATDVPWPTHAAARHRPHGPVRWPLALRDGPAARRRSSRRPQRTVGATVRRRRGRLGGIAFVVLAAGAILHASPACARQQQGVAIERVTIVDVRDDSLRPGQTVIVKGRRIDTVGPAADVVVPAGVRRVDARGLYLIPGLWDMHVHVAANAARDLPLLLAWGVTGVRNMHTTVDTALELTEAVKRRLADGRLTGPRFIANGGVLDGPVPIYPGAVALGSPAAGRSAVDSLVRMGADFIKVYSRLPREVYFAVAAEAKRIGVPFVGHVPNALRVAEAADAGQRSIEHIDAFIFDCSASGDSIRNMLASAGSPGGAAPPDFLAWVRLQQKLLQSWSVRRCPGAVDALRRNATWFVPTFAVFHASARADSVLNDPVTVANIGEARLRAWKAQEEGTPPLIAQVDEQNMVAGVELVRALHAAGVHMLAGTDLGNAFLVPGFSLHRELELMTAAGLSSLEALQAATLEPARLLAATDSLGTVEPGKLADLVLLEANPLDDVRNTRRIRAVVSDGRFFDRGAIDGLIERSKEVGRSR